MNEQPEKKVVELMETMLNPAPALEAINRAEIDIQIATAHKYPRSMQRFQEHALSLATLDEKTAESCIYCRAVGKKDGKTEYAEGMSIRMAEIVAASYGNIRVGSMIIEQTDRQVVARGYAHDLESNFASTSEVIESTVTKDGYPFSERMRIVVAKAALAKARRDATFQVVPRAIAKPIEEACRKLAVGDVTTVSKRRDNALKWIKSLGIDAHRVWVALGISGEADLDIEKLTTLAGLRTAIKEGDETIDSVFPERQSPDEAETVASGFSRRGRPVGSKNKPKAEPAQAEPAQASASTVPPIPAELTESVATDYSIVPKFEYDGKPCPVSGKAWKDIPKGWFDHFQAHGFSYKWWTQEYQNHLEKSLIECLPA